jgi:succinate dehydrogenase/fumarate reductase flavoprotein subunit
VHASVARAAAPLGREGIAADVVLQELKDVMWRGCGLVRSRDGLEDAQQRVEELRERSLTFAARGPREWNAGWQQALDVVNQLEVARTMIASALVREESRGAHFREDFPERSDEDWLRYVVARVDGEAVETETRPVVFTRSQPPAAVGA